MTYLALARLAFQRQLTYRTAHLAGLATNAFFGLLRASVMVALFGAQTQVAGYSLPAAITFTGLTQALISYINIFPWWDVMKSIRTGEVASDLSRPIDFFWYWAAQDVGRALGNLLFRGLPIMGLYALFYHITVPQRLEQWAALVASLGLALFISFCWRFLVNLAAFWTQDATGLGRVAWTLTVFFSGFLMPLAFLPSWLTTLTHLTPFPAMMATPAEIYLGLTTGRGLLTALVTQAAWAVIFYIVIRFTLAAGVKKLVIQGG